MKAVLAYVDGVFILMMVLKRVSGFYCTLAFMYMNICRYKIYVEGWAWSVSEKYIMACDSMNLYIRPHFYDFFIRDMVPLQHYWPIRDTSKCTSLKFAVEWGNNHPHQVTVSHSHFLSPLST